MLQFTDRGYQVMTNSWSVSSKGPAANIEICYVWGHDAFGFIDSSTGVARRSFNFTFDQFQRLVQSSDGRLLNLSAYS